TTDSSLLLKQLARHNRSQLPERAAGEGSSFNSDTDPAALPFDAWLGGTGVSRQESEFYRVNPATGTYRAVQFIANHLAGLRGRKNLIWVSGGFPTEAVRVLDHANVAIYPVDARGLVADQRFTAESRPTSIDPTNPRQPLTMGSIEKMTEVENQQRQ